MIVDGRTVAADILKDTKERVVRLRVTPIVRAVTCAPSPATISYLKIKAARAEDAGMRLEVVRLADDASKDALLEAVRKPGAHAVIVQLPLPPHLDTKEIVNAIPIEKDADVLSARAYEAFEINADASVLPPVVEAIREVLARTQVNVSGKEVVVVGQGKLVGLPAAHWLAFSGAHVQVITRDMNAHERLRLADIIVSGAGSPGVITPDDLKEGVVLIDAGTSESGGQVVGDADPACAEKAHVFTPVPGGMGPIAVACLFRNVVTLLERSLQESQKAVH